MRAGQPRKVVGLIGYPLRHSISPTFQQAAFDFHHLPVTYQAWETPPDRLDDALERVRQPDCLGMNVTVPHKQAVIARLDSVDERAAQIGAVNTITNKDGRLAGFNTDAAGMIRPLLETGFDIRGCRAVVLGAGGVARAAAFALNWEAADEVLVLARRLEQATNLAQSVGARAGRLGDSIRGFDLIVNCTPMGMLHSTAEGESPIAPDQIEKGMLVYDLVYNPATTPLLAAARRVGARTLGGLPMLVYQGAAAFEIWTGQSAPVGLMMARAEEALRR